VTSRQFIRWTRLHEQRARSRTAALVPVLVAAAFAFFVHWRVQVSDPIEASHAWLACTLVAFALAFMRVPFQLYWRPDAAFLAQLPIPGEALFDAALVRCVRAAAITTGIALVGAAPLFTVDPAQLAWLTREPKPIPIAGQVPGLSVTEFVVRHAILAGVLGVIAAALLPAVATWAASLVRRDALALATSLAGAPARDKPATAPPTAGSAATLLGALPGFASTVVIVLILIAAAWLENAEGVLSPIGVMAGLVGVSLAALFGVRSSAPRVMGSILRDVSALDRQQLATLEIRPPTALERVIAGMLGDAELPYRKDARLMRRRYPMAYALGALCFATLVIVGLARPVDPTPWLVVVLGGAGVYAIALTSRLFRPPIELPRLAATLPITSESRKRAKVAWIATWILVFVAVPAAFAAVRLL
jgi:hypothetical protein